ncbi:hypothetical protein [Eilatimonas milleporae]|nr:hypothetical protein [Eilatimonas milleporae]
MMRVWPAFLVFLLTVLSLALDAQDMDGDEPGPDDQAMARAEALVNAVGGIGNPRALVPFYRDVEKVWKDFTAFYPPITAPGPRLALVRARTLSAVRQQDGLQTAWETAISLWADQLPVGEYRSLLREAGEALANVGSMAAAKHYFSKAEAGLSPTRPTDLEGWTAMRFASLMSMAGEGDWRVHEADIGDIRAFMKRLPLWSDLRLRALVSEACVRHTYQPRERGKRDAISAVKAEILLAMKSRDKPVPDDLRDDIRALFRLLEDEYDL